MVIFLSDDACRDARVAGTKAATLARLAQAGFPVPGGFVVTVAACEAIGADGRCPAALRAEIEAALGALGAGVVAARSSARAEDGADASFAGQFLSLLGVAAEADAVCAAVEKVVASAGFERVDAYGARIGSASRPSADAAADAGADPAAIAVLVQQQVDARAAGIAFTADPVTGDRDRILVSAVRGLGDRLAAGIATPQEWVVHGGVAREVSGPEARGEREGALSPAEGAEVAALARRVEAELGGPQDIEWALADGVVRLLQSRPITALPTPPDVSLPEGTWFKESGRRAELITPFGASVALPIVSDGLALAFAHIGSLLERIEMRSIGGEVYVSLMPVGGRRPGPPPPWWLLGVLARVVPPLRARCRAARVALEPGEIARVVRRWQEEWRPSITEAAERLRALDMKAMPDDELSAHLAEAIALTRRGLEAHFRLMPAFVITLHELVAACRELLGWDSTRSIELLSGLSSATSEPTRALRAIVATAARPAAARQALEAPQGDVLVALREADPELARAFDEWRERYGWRALGEDPGALTLAEQPAMLAGLLRDALAVGEPAPERDIDHRREAAIDRARARLAAAKPPDRERFEAALAAASMVYPTREDSAVWAACHPAGLIRRALIEAGRRLAAAGLLDKPDDVALLAVDTVQAALGGSSGGRALRAMVARARAERAWVAAHPGPAVLGPAPFPPPDFRGLPAAARRANAALMWNDAQQRSKPAPASADGALRGAPGSPGRHAGPVRVVRHFDEFDRVKPGDVLVCPATDPSWSVLFGTVGAIVTEGGGALSHAAIVAREHGVPAVLAVADATRVLRDGQVVTVDGTAGAVLVDGGHDAAEISSQVTTNPEGEQ